MAILSLPVVIILLILMLYGIISNIILIILFARQRRYTFDQKAFVISVNVADLLALTTAVIITSITHFMEAQESQAALLVCKILAVVVTSVLHSSALNLCLVAFHRLFSVYKPGKMNIYFSRNCCYGKFISIIIISAKFTCCKFNFQTGMILAIWLLSCIPSIIGLASGWCNLEYFPGKNICMFDYPKNLSYTIFVIVLYTIFPVIFVTVAYTLLFRVVILARKRVSSPEASQQSSTISENGKKNKLKRENRLLIQLIFISAIFMLLWLPSSTLARFKGYGKNDKNPIGTISSALMLLNAIFNPLIYILPNSLLKQDLKRLICFCNSK